MPTFTTIALDRLIEPNASKPMAAGKTIHKSKLERSYSFSAVQRQSSGFNGTDKKPEPRNSTTNMDRKHHWTQISPALYATPEPTPLPDTPTSFPPSPYIVDHKRRGPRLSKTFSDVEDTLRQVLAGEKPIENEKSLEEDNVGSSKVVVTTNTVEDNHVKFALNEEPGNNTTSNDEAVGQAKPRKSGTSEPKDTETDDFFDPQDSMSVKSSIDGESNYGADRPLHPITPFSEFYDAWEDLSHENGSQHPPNDIEAELREIRLALLTEMEKRKQAETCLNDLQRQWERIREQLSLVGLRLLDDPSVLEDESAEELCRQVHVVRFVSNSIGKGIARAEVEVEMEAQLQSKNFEIGRLMDKLRYYEAVNHEMSQRNQESVETMRRLRQRRKRRQKWIWGSIAGAITLGSGALVWSYLPTGKGSSSEGAK